MQLNLKSTVRSSSSVVYSSLQSPAYYGSINYGNNKCRSLILLIIAAHRQRTIVSRPPPSLHSSPIGTNRSLQLLILTVLSCSLLAWCVGNHYFSPRTVRLTRGWRLSLSIGWQKQSAAQSERMRPLALTSITSNIIMRMPRLRSTA